MSRIDGVKMKDEIEKMYVAFSSVRKPTDFDFCECCMQESTKTLLLNRKLRDIEPNEIESYASSVFYTLGDTADFQYFFPRIIELSLNHQFGFTDVEVIYKKLPMAEWQTWTDAQRQATVDLTVAKFTEVISRPEPNGFEIDSWIFALAFCASDLRRYLDMLSEKGREKALAEYIEANVSCLTKNKLANAYWEPDMPGQQEILNWFRSDAVVIYLYANYGIVLSRRGDC